MNYNDLALAEEESKLEAALQESHNLLIEAPTGSGKSLFIPYFLSKHCGKTIGYQFRQESCKSADTRILFQTYGNFLQELLHGKLDADWVVFDEYHERKADMDLLFAYFMNRRSPVKPGMTATRVAVMSAALNRDELEAVLGVKCLSLGHPLYPVQILNQTPATGTSLVSGVGLDAEVVRALKTLYRNGIWQTTLVFLPGKAEIARCHSAAAEALGNNCAEFLELYGGQDRETQDRIFEVTERPRVIFTTNIAETSITVPNVTGVVDSGIERVSLYDDSEKVNVLRTMPISMQNAIQRSGRSGRTQNGCAVRLWSEESEKRMPRGIVPEVLQIEPSELLLQKAALEYGTLSTACHSGAEQRGAIESMDPIRRPADSFQGDEHEIILPTAIPEAREQVATKLLEGFGMLQDGAITPLGLKAIRTPVSSIPLALLLASARGPEDLPDLLLAALAWIHSGTEFLQKSKVAYDVMTLAADTLSKAVTVPREVSFTLRQLREYREKDLWCDKGSACHSGAEHRGAIESMDPISRPTDSFQGDNPASHTPHSTPHTSLFTAQSLLKAFPDRLATPSGNAYKLPNQNIIRLQVAEPPYAILALSMLRAGSGSKSELKVNLYATIDKELLGSNDTKTRYELLWRSGQERFIGVEINEAENADGSTTELSRKEILTQEASPKVLAELKKLTVAAWKEKIEKENWSGRYLTEAMETLLVKMRLAAKLYPEYGLPEFNDEDMELIFDEFADGKFLLRDINEDRFRNIVEDYFGKSMLAWLGKTFPDHFVLPNGKRARYSYQAVADDELSGGKSVQSAEGVLVEISARIEDFMQMRGEHKIADGKLKVRYDILAPNFRTIQKTWDLTGFWQNTYAEVRKELRGRYPKHPWPETVGD